MASGTRPGKPTLDQRRARHAWRAITRIKEEFAKDKAKDYAGEAKKLPARILAAGLGSVLAFILAKAQRGTRDEKLHLARLHEDLTDWVIRERPMTAPARDSLLKSIIEADSDFLRRATDETLAYLQWLNRFAEAEGLTEGA